MASDSTPTGREGEPGNSPRLAEALAGIAPGALPDIAEVIVLHREFPAWAVWLPQGGRLWTAVRPASRRVPGSDLPMIWVRAGTAAGLAGRMRAADAQLADPAVTAEADAGERPDGGHADPDVAPDAGSKELMAGYEAVQKRLEELEARAKAIEDRRQAALGAPGGTGEGVASQPGAGVPPAEQQNQKEVKAKGDRRRRWPSLRTQIHTMVAGTVTLAVADQFLPGGPHPAILVFAAGVCLSTLEPTARVSALWKKWKGWKRKHDARMGSRRGGA